MRISLLALCLTLGMGSLSPALAQPTNPAQVAPADEIATPQKRLDEAVRSYQLGQREEARQLLSELVVDDTYIDPALRQEARVYLAELLYTQGDEEGSRRFFEQVLRTDPSYVIDHFRHPPDVVAYFGYVRAYMVPAPHPQPATPAPPIHWSAWMPIGGVYHLSHGAPGRGIAYLSTESILIAGSLGIYFARLPEDQRSYDEGDVDSRGRLQGVQYTQWALTAAYWTVWTIARVDASRHWRVEVVPTLHTETSGALVPGASGTLQARF